MGVLQPEAKPSAGLLHQPRQQELTLQVLHVEVLKLPLDLAEQVHQIAPQGQRKLGVLQGSKEEEAAHIPPRRRRTLELR